MKDITSKLVDREHELERKRARSLARQQWADVIEADARIAECQNFRKLLVDDALAKAQPTIVTQMTPP